MNKTNGIKTFAYGVLSQVIVMALGVVVPRLVLTNLGSEANGLFSSVGNILAYMALLEAGVGTATLNALFAPLGKNDHDAINRIMAATHHFYKRTGYIYLAIVVVLSLAYPVFISTSLPRMTVFLVVLLAGMSGAIPYFFQGKFNVLLSAEGKGYITTNILTFISVLTSLGKIILLSLGYDVIAIQVMHFLLVLIQMAIVLWYVRRHYKWMDLSVQPDFQSISQKNAVLVHQIAALVFSNTDVILLSFLTDLKYVSVYSMYAMIFGMVKAITVTVSTSYIYALGQRFNERERFLKLFDVYEVYSMAFTSALFCVAGLLICPFLKLYTAGVNDISYIDQYLPWLFVAFYFLHNARASSAYLINIAQEFENTKWRAIIEAAINLLSSVILTYYWGIYGVLLGTIIALLYRANDMIFYGARILKRSPWFTYRRWLCNVVLLFVCCFVVSQFDLEINTYFEFLMHGMIFSVTIVPLYFIVNSALERSSARYAWNIVIGMLKQITSREIIKHT